MVFSNECSQFLGAYKLKFISKWTFSAVHDNIGLIIHDVLLLFISVQNVKTLFCLKM